jgi:hypothetical protein
MLSKSLHLSLQAKVFCMATPTAQDQLFLELVNRARLDPLAEAARFGIDNGNDFGRAKTGSDIQSFIE